jgi:hypothetical protein
LDTRVTVDFNYNLFLSEKNAWKVSKPNSYQFNLSNFGWGDYVPIDALIVVEDGQFKEQIPGDAMAGEYYQTIDKIYETVEYSYKEYNNTQPYKNDFYLTKIKIEYDSVNHIPIIIEYFYYVPENMMDMGEYFVYKIENYIKNE